MSRNNNRHHNAYPAVWRIAILCNLRRETTPCPGALQGGLALDEFELGEKAHKIEILQREQVRIQGVIHVESFDERQVTIETDLGMITMIGEEFHITSLDLDKGLMVLEGAFTGLEYSGTERSKSKQKDKGLLQRLFR